jgi:hypothetical protein
LNSKSDFDHDKEHALGAGHFGLRFIYLLLGERISTLIHLLN